MADDDDDGLGLFQEPTDFYKPEPKPTTVTHLLRDGRAVHIQLVGHNPLWGHHLWNAGRCIADFLEDNAGLIEDQTVLELGAGGGLPSIVAAIRGAETVVVTDYPDIDLIENLQHNIDSSQLLQSSTSIFACGHLWGAHPEELKSLSPGVKDGFDVLILADLLFNHSEHQKLVASIQKTLKCDGNSQALVFFTPYRPWLLEKDLAFFELAELGGFTVEKIFEHVMDEVMFAEDPGDELLRRTVFGYRLRWQQTEWISVMDTCKAANVLNSQTR